MNEEQKDLLFINPLPANIALSNGCIMKRIGKNNAVKKCPNCGQLESSERSVFYFEDTEKAQQILEAYKNSNKPINI